MNVLVEPRKKLYVFGPEPGPECFATAISSRMAALMAEKTGLDLFEDLGYVGCQAVISTTSKIPYTEAWYEFEIPKSTEKKTDNFGSVIVTPRPELQIFENYLYFGNILENCKIITRDFPILNDKGKVVNVKRKKALLQIKGYLPAALAFIIDADISDKYWAVRYKEAEFGNRFMGEYTDPDIVQSFLPVTTSVTVSYKHDAYDPDSAEIEYHNYMESRNEKALTIEKDSGKHKKQKEEKVVKKDKKENTNFKNPKKSKGKGFGGL